MILSDTKNNCTFYEFVHEEGAGIQFFNEDKAVSKLGAIFSYKIKAYSLKK